LTRVWRICQKRHARNPDPGDGARLHGGRWNHRGTAMVYTSATRSLAALELLVHFDTDIAPATFVAVPVEIPDRLVLRLPEKDLPADWRAVPAPDSTRNLGTKWATSGRSVALSVPSVQVPDERNVLLNPVHPDFPRVSFGAARPFEFDPRLVLRKQV